MTISENIKKYRKNAGITQRELAEKCHCATGTIQQYELGKRQPRIEQLEKIAGALNVSVSTLIDNNTLNLTNDMLQLFADSNITIEPSNPTTKEHYLISKFRDLNDKGQQKTIDYVEDISQLQEYRKE